MSLDPHNSGGIGRSNLDPKNRQNDVAASLIGAGANLLGGLIGSNSAKGAAKASRKFIKFMYENRYQMQMKDMRAAGLNPILSAYTGAPTAPGGPVADTSMIAPSIANATSTALRGAELAATRAQAAKTGEEAQAVAIDNETRRQINQERLSREIDIGDEQAYRTHSARSQANAEATGEKAILTTHDRQQLESGAAAKSQADSAALEREAKAALLRAGLPAAEFEGAGGKYLIDAMKLILTKGRR